MNEQLRKKIVYGVLVLAIIWGIYNFLPKDKENQNGIISPVVAPAVMPVASQMPPVEKAIDVAEMKNKNWGDDPFRSMEKKTGTHDTVGKPRWRLSGIVYNSFKPLAIINGKSVAVGDKLGNASIVEIKKESVVMEQSGTRVTLKVSKS